VIRHSAQTASTPTPLQQFRAKTSRQRIHPREGLLVGVVTTQLVFLPWALGGMPLRSQLTSFGLGLFALAVALLPRNYDEATAPGQAPFRLYTFLKDRG
jgi:hypothetical protein